ncbi:MAG: aminotransferase class IV [Bacteroidota bacterium]
MGNIVVINGQAVDASGYQPDLSADVYYEVARLIDRKILFLDDHLLRFKKSLSASGLHYPGDHMILESLRILLQQNDETLGNIRICLQKSRGKEPNLLCYFVPCYYPEPSMYLSGVQLVIYPHERSNPGIKKWDNRFRESVAGHIRDHGVYEVLLVNARGEITEGSRSNVFFIDPMDRLVSPPEKDILPGISRKYVLQICADEHIEVIERPVFRTELGDLVGCFISGTSPKVLPVWQLEGTRFRVDHPVLRKIMEGFDALLQDNLKTIL